MTKVIAAYFAYWTGYSIGAQKGVISTNTLWLALASIAAAFGKSTFNFLLSKLSLQSSSVQADTRSFERKEVDVHIDETRRLTEERRIEDGAPPRSMPPVGATVPE